MRKTRKGQKIYVVVHSSDGEPVIDGAWTKLKEAQRNHKLALDFVQNVGGYAEIDAVVLDARGVFDDEDEEDAEEKP